jgi:transcription elongation GreA/GreB family factor
MSKAFVKDDAPPEEVNLNRRELTAPGENYVTSQGLEKFKQEAAGLRREKDAKTNERLLFLEYLIKTAHVIVSENQQGERILFGATVKVIDESESERIYKLVGVEETDIKSGKISWISPIGKSLLQARVGDEVKVVTPRSTEFLTVISISFIPIE